MPRETEAKETLDKNSENPGENKKASYDGVHNMYSGVYDTYSGVRADYPGVGTNGEAAETEESDPTVAPGMRDFLEKDAAPGEVKKGDYTKVTTLSYDETH